MGMLRDQYPNRSTFLVVDIGWQWVDSIAVIGLNSRCLNSVYYIVGKPDGKLILEPLFRFCPHENSTPWSLGLKG